MTWPSVNIIIFIIAAIFVLVGLAGICGGIETRWARLPKLTPGSGIVLMVLGIVGLAVGVILMLADRPQPSLQVWKVIVTNPHTRNTSFPNCSVTFSPGDEYLILNVSFENVSSQTQTLDNNHIKLQDSTGQSYPRSQCNEPNKTWSVDAKSSINLQLIFVVPKSKNHFTFSVINPVSQGVDESWNIDV